VPIGGYATRLSACLSVDLFLKHSLAAGRLQLGELAGQVSGVGRDAGISENYALICNRLMKQKSAIGSARRACCEILDFCTRSRARVERPRGSDKVTVASLRRPREKGGEVGVYFRKRHIGTGIVERPADAGADRGQIFGGLSRSAGIAKNRHAGG
jgi:hypothetical protein